MQIIKTMQKIIPIIILCLICKVNAQVVDRCTSTDTFATYQPGVHYKDLTHNFDPFIGIWKNVTGNKTFKVNLFKVENVDYGEGYFLDIISGHFMMIQNEGQPNEIILYNSNKPIGPGSLYYWEPVISGAACGNGFGGAITDNCVPDPFQVSGRLEISLIPGTNTAHWKITRLEGIRIQGFPDFVVPQDIILTKQ